MSDKEKTQITVQATINAPMEKVWNAYNTPEDIMKWCAASDDWHVPKAQNDLREGGRSNTRMEAKDGSFGFDFSWVYTKVNDHQALEYTLDDDRKVSVKFDDTDGGVKITQTFEAEETNPIEMQRGGWQAILDNLKKYVENQ